MKQPSTLNGMELCCSTTTDERDGTLSNSRLASDVLGHGSVCMILDLKSRYLYQEQYYLAEILPGISVFIVI